MTTSKRTNTGEAMFKKSITLTEYMKWGVFAPISNKKVRATCAITYGALVIGAIIYSARALMAPKPEAAV